MSTATPTKNVLGHEVREYTVEQLIAALSKMPKDAPVKLVDADTLHTIHKFNVSVDAQTVWIEPSDYPDMTAPTGGE